MVHNAKILGNVQMLLSDPLQRSHFVLKILLSLRFLKKCVLVGVFCQNLLDIWGKLSLEELKRFILIKFLLLHVL